MDSIFLSHDKITNSHILEKKWLNKIIEWWAVTQILFEHDQRTHSITYIHCTHINRVKNIYIKKNKTRIPFPHIHIIVFATPKSWIHTKYSTVDLFTVSKIKISFFVSECARQTVANNRVHIKRCHRHRGCCHWSRIFVINNNCRYFNGNRQPCIMLLHTYSERVTEK